MELQYHPGPVRKLSETCRVSCQNKFVKLVHLVGIIIKGVCYDTARSHERKKITK
jgi:hypothetical protein